MSFHPAYPSTAALSREHDAEDRNVADLVALRDLRSIVADAISRAGRIDRIQHPDRRWTTADLLEVLQDELANIDDTAAMIRVSSVTARRWLSGKLPIPAEVARVIEQMAALAETLAHKLNAFRGPQGSP